MSRLLLAQALLRNAFSLVVACATLDIPFRRGDDVLGVMSREPRRAMLLRLRLLVLLLRLLLAALATRPRAIRAFCLE